jgi:hypothetical protein
MSGCAQKPPNVGALHGFRQSEACAWWFTRSSLIWRPKRWLGLLVLSSTIHSSVTKSPSEGIILKQGDEIATVDFAAFDHVAKTGVLIIEALRLFVVVLGRHVNLLSE